MSRFHTKKRSKTDTTKHANWMGGAAYFLSDPVRTLEIAAASCFFGEPMYYHRDGDDKRTVRRDPSWRLDDRKVAYLRETLNALDPQEWRSMTPAEMMESAIDKALDHDPERTLQVAAQLRDDGNIRTTPQVILVRAAHHAKVRGTGLVRKYAPRILLRCDEPVVGLAYHLWRFKGSKLPNSLKKAWRDRLARATEYELAKYRMEGRGVKLVDVVNLVHPASDNVNKLMRGELKTTDKTWEAILSKDGRSTESWDKAIDVMGHMALLRNLRNFIKADVPTERYLGKLVEGARKGRQLPFRYYSAYRAIESHGATGRVLDAVEECLSLSMDNVPKFTGRLMALCDNSGSARGTATSSMGTMCVATIGNLTGLIAGGRADDGHLGVFGDRLETFAVRPKASVFDQLKKAEKLGNQVGGGTENGIWLFWDKAIRNEEHWDHVMVFSDQQAGHGGLYGIDPGQYRDYRWNQSGYGEAHIDVAKLINAYRAKVNPKVNVYLVQIAGHQDMILPEFYERTYMLGGWGEGVLRFAAQMANLLDQSQQQAA